MKRKPIKKRNGAKYFLIIVLLMYIVVALVDFGTFSESTIFFQNLIFKLIPMFFIVIILMTLSNYFVTPKFVQKHLREKGVKKWFFIIVGGILSSGPIYMWYPLLKDLKDKGLKSGLIACFLYNRAIKIPLIPIAAVYFSWKYIIVLTLVMIFMSIIQGLIINKIMEKEIK